MAKFGESWVDAAQLGVGVAAIALGAPLPPGAAETVIGGGGLIRRVLGAKQKFGPECDRTRRRIQESVRAGFTKMLEIEGDDWSAHPELEAADAALSAALKGCMIDRKRLAAAAVAREGFAGGAVAAVMKGLAAAHPALFSPEREGTLAHQYAEAVVSAGVRAAAENADWYRALEPDLILAIGQALGATRDEVKAGREENRAGFETVRAELAELKAFLTAKFGGAEKVDETAERLHVSRPELLALLEAILEEETPESEIDAALVRGRERLRETKEEIARLRKQGNEAPEAQADLEAAAAALARPDIADLAAAQEALARARARWLEGRARARAARAAEEAAARAREDATTFQFFMAEADLAKARLDHEGAARLLEAGAAEVEAESRERMLLFGAAGDARAVSGGFIAGKSAYQTKLTLSRARLSAMPEDNARMRDVSESLRRVGDVQVESGDSAGALTAFRESLEIARDLVERDPSDPLRKLDVCVSLRRIGNVLLAVGHRAEALTVYEEALAISRDLAARDPENLESEWALLASLVKIGELRTLEGYRTGGLAAYKEGLAIARKCAERAPDDPEWTRQISASLEQIGRILMAELDQAGALAACEEGLAIARNLAQRDPSNAAWALDVAANLHGVGEARLAVGDRAGALAAHKEGHAIARDLAARDPSNSEWARNVSVSLFKVGEVRLEAGDVAGALTDHEEGLVIARHLAARDQGNMDRMRVLMACLVKVGEVRLLVGLRSGARAAFEQSLAIARELAIRDPGNVNWKRDVVVSLQRMAQADEARAAEYWAEAVERLEAMEERGIIAPSDEWILPMAREELSKARAR